jgi:hypothetical protein
LPKLQPSVPLEIEQVPGPLYAGLTLQLRPDPEGSRSLRVTAWAAAPALLLTVSVYPIGEPAATLAASAVLVNPRTGAPWVYRVDTSDAVKARL